MSKKISFKGQLADGGIDKIKLRTLDGKTGYQITKFEIFPAVQDSAKDNLVCISNDVITTAITSANFSDDTLLASALMFNGTYEIQQTVVFDNELFNQDIYISNVDSIGANAMNYYIELKVMSITDTQSTQLTLKNLRSLASR